MTVRPATAVTAAATVIGVAGLLRLSAWQWHRGSTRGSLLHYTYAVEWLVLAVVLVAAVAVRHRRGSRRYDDDAASRDVTGRLIGPPLPPGEPVPEATHVRVRRRLTGRP